MNRSHHNEVNDRAAYKSPYSRTHPKKAVPKPDDDPPRIVPCPYCNESVLAVGGRYLEFNELRGIYGDGAQFPYETVMRLDHRHQPRSNKDERTPQQFKFPPKKKEKTK